jgi:hypothetical protein
MDIFEGDKMKKYLALVSSIGSLSAPAFSQSNLITIRDFKPAPSRLEEKKKPTPNGEMSPEEEMFLNFVENMKNVFGIKAQATDILSLPGGTQESGTGQ